MDHQLAQYLFKLVKTGDLTKFQNAFEAIPNIVTDPQMFHSTWIDGHSHISQWLFRSACVDGHLHIAQWLFDVNPDINISERGEQAFRFVCDFDHLHIAKWLIQVKPDINISIYKDVSFRSACFEDRIEIAEWLYQIRPYHYILKVNKKNQIIHYDVRPFAEIKWLERREPLMAHYNKKEKNVFWNLSKDIVRNICEYI